MFQMQNLPRSVPALRWEAGREQQPPPGKLPSGTAASTPWLPAPAPSRAAPSCSELLRAAQPPPKRPRTHPAGPARAARSAPLRSPPLRSAPLPSAPLRAAAPQRCRPPGQRPAALRGCRAPPAARLQTASRWLLPAQTKGCRAQRSRAGGCPGRASLASWESGPGPGQEGQEV